jgi:lysophospholipase L1-like esterase
MAIHQELEKICALVLVFVFVGTVPARAQNPPAKFNPPRSYYLALGDSITYGYQAFEAQANLPPSAYNTGYVDAFATRLRQIRPNITVINYGCPGESTDSFVNGPCPCAATGNQLHNAFSGTQLQAAIEFLHAHRGQVSPITLTLSGNDLPILLNPCTAGGQIDLSCVQANAPAFIAGFAERISDILQQLRSTAPDAEIIVTGAWDSYITILAFADPLYQALNKAIAEAAAANRARFADVFPIFNPQGDLAAEVQTVCRLSLLCTGNDSHPSDAGYQALADVVFAVFDSAGHNRECNDCFVDER